MLAVSPGAISLGSTFTDETETADVKNARKGYADNVVVNALSVYITFPIAKFSALPIKLE